VVHIGNKQGIDVTRYTLAVGRAPFHAPKREDIYRKLKAREYTWPDLAKFANEITDDLRDIVSLLLVHEDDRPTPDQIVAHPFFKLGHIPLQLESACTSRVPKWPKNRPPTASAIRRGYTEEWWEMCKASAVGEYEPGKSFGALGNRRNKTVARDCQKEIESGKQPNIPFAMDTVYLPFPARTHWPFQAAGGLSEIPEEKESSSEGRALVEGTGNDRTKGRPARIVGKEEIPPTLKENQTPVQELELETTKKVLEKAPTRMRSVRKISNPGRVTAASATTVPLRVPRETRTTLQRTRSTKEVTKEKEDPAPEVKENIRPIQRTRSTREAPKEKEPLVVEVKPVRVVKTSARVAEKSERLVAQTSRTKTAIPLRTLSIELPATDPVTVLARLYTFHDNIARALEKKPSNSKRDKVPNLPFVSKWVDYSRKYGVGYVLEDGSVGCLATATARHPVTVAFSADGHAHLRKLSKDLDHAESIPMQFYAAPSRTKGLSKVEVMDKERRDAILTIWQKFGKYMCTQLGTEDLLRKREPQPVNFVKFYQRVSNVGIWGFGDGSFQVS
jgi:myosin-1